MTEGRLDRAGFNRLKRTKEVKRAFEAHARRFEELRAHVPDMPVHLAIECDMAIHNATKALRACDLHGAEEWDAEVGRVLRDLVHWAAHERPECVRVVRQGTERDVVRAGRRKPSSAIGK